MKTTLHRLILTALVLAFTPALVHAAPLRVGTTAGDSQTVLTCPHCGRAIASSQAGDYTVTFSAEGIHPKTGSARFSVAITDRTGKPVRGAKVLLVLAMPAHHHGPVNVPATGGAGGRYVAVTNLSPHMHGQWTAEVQITTAEGKTASQTFTFDQ